MYSMNYFDHLKIQKKEFRDRYQIISEIEKMNPSDRAAK